MLAMLSKAAFWVDPVIKWQEWRTFSEGSTSHSPGETARVHLCPFRIVSFDIFCGPIEKWDFEFCKNFFERSKTSIKSFFLRLQWHPKKFYAGMHKTYWTSFSLQSCTAITSYSARCIVNPKRLGDKISRPTVHWLDRWLLRLHPISWPPRVENQRALKTSLAPLDDYRLVENTQLFVYYKGGPSFLKDPLKTSKPLKIPKWASVSPRGIGSWQFPFQKTATPGG